ncbi:MAG: PRC-barrel domain-containing protein [Paracoccus sp. (in: a-proteobacteria)]|uniref:PRC-barrel domain-containing protein n=1 Tax=Paracoccus sp. TaxID=267 RepID=UPI0026E00457|nr:PRC-barrel domain-containing protein [Paracoccus sp. (in: a-proteobacteria)]MDO5622721.1 PRC-barrel domain-containing protein [Paracoccus sp. (in: a-proteobacteria)]
MIQLKSGLTALLLAAAISGPALAQTAPAITEIVLIDEIQIAEYGSARAWIDAHVRGAGDERIGRVHDLLLGADNQVVALVVGVGGFLGIDEKYVAIPLADATAETVGDDIEFSTSYTRDQLRAVVDK